jgi:hypothetical protein
LDHLTIPFLKPIAEGFFENIQRVESLIAMPLMMFSMLEVDAQFHQRSTSMVFDLIRGKKPDSSDLERLDYYPKHDPELVERTRKREEKVLAIPGVGEPLQRAIQVLYSASVSGSWTAFECLAADLWVDALNSEALLLAQRAISSIETQEPGEISAKQIPVGLAARHGFDLRNCLGTILRTKFDFTSVSGIRKAYQVFAPIDDFVEKVFATPRLAELEATRHVIVHKAGKIDTEYCRRTKSTLPIGSVLTFDRDQSQLFCNVSVIAGTGLLAFVNDWLVREKGAASQ